MDWRSDRRVRTAGGIVLLIGLGIAATRFSGDALASDPDPFGWQTVEAPEQEAPTRDLHGMDVDLAGIKGGETYEQFDSARDRSNVDNFEGFGCMESCEGHEAGYAWAEAQGITDPADCGGNSWSFIEGCVAYASDNQDPAADQDADQQG